MENSNLEQFLRKSRKRLVGLTALAALIVPSACELEKEEDPSSGGNYGGGPLSQYVCDCKGNGFYAIMEATASSVGSANTLTTKQCQQDYPSVGCHCSCKSKQSTPPPTSTGSKYPSCNEVPEGYDGICVNDNW